jgi:peptide chain release factor subunit 1
MRANDVTPERLRDLASATGRGKVLSLFVNLDPSEFGTIPARASQVRSVLDRAARVVRAADDGLTHEERTALRADLERVEAELEGASAGGGARGLAVFASSQAGIFQALRLPVPVDHEPVVADTPFVEPLTPLAGGERWAVLLVNRSFARLLAGGRDTLAELALVESDVHGRHDQGGWSQARYQRSVEQDVHEHLKAVAETAARLLRPRRPTGLVLGAPEETLHAVEAALPSDLRGLVAGHVTVDVEHASADEVRAAAAEVVDRVAREREDRLLARLKEGLARQSADTRAAAGVADTLLALSEQRVEALLLDEGAHAPGVVCPRCGLLAVDGTASCPADGTSTEAREDVLPDAIDRAIAQDARVVVLRERPDLGPHEHVAAVLRF